MAESASPSVLTAHRSRIAAYGQALDELHRHHEQSHALWSRIVQLAESTQSEARDELDLLRDQVYALSGRIAKLREQTFGEISREARLRISAEVESIHPARLNPQPELLESR